MQTSAQTLLPTLYRSHRSALLRFLVKRLQSVDDAEDVSQEVFLRLWVATQLASPEHARALAFRAASNLAVDNLRRRHTRSLCEDANMDIGAVASSAPSHEERLHSMQRLQILQSAIQALPEKCRRVFVMYKLQHLSYEEISEKLDLSRYAVEKHVARGLGFCRKRLLARSDE